MDERRLVCLEARKSNKTPAYCLYLLDNEHYVAALDYMKKIEAFLPEKLIERLNEQASNRGIARAELIRDYLRSASRPFSVSPCDLRAAALKVRQRCGYGLDRNQAESIVSTVCVELAQLNVIKAREKY